MRRSYRLTKQSAVDVLHACVKQSGGALDTLDETGQTEVLIRTVGTITVQSQAHEDDRTAPHLGKRTHHGD